MKVASPVNFLDDLLAKNHVAVEGLAAKSGLPHGDHTSAGRGVPASFWSVHASGAAKPTNGPDFNK